MNAVEVVVRAYCAQGEFFTSGKKLRILVFSEVKLDLANPGHMKLYLHVQCRVATESQQTILSNRKLLTE